MYQIKLAYFPVRMYWKPDSTLSLECCSQSRMAKVVPIYMSKNKEEFNNYRPVSLLPCISKILEKIIHKRLYSVLLLQNIFYNSQYGFRTKHSKINAVTELSNHIAKSIDNKQCTLAVFLDPSKAFDTIDHMTLLWHYYQNWPIMAIMGSGVLPWSGSETTLLTEDNTLRLMKLLRMEYPRGLFLGPFSLLFMLMTCQKLYWLYITHAWLEINLLTYLLTWVGENILGHYLIKTIWHYHVQLVDCPTTFNIQVNITQCNTTDRYITQPNTIEIWLLNKINKI